MERFKELGDRVFNVLGVTDTDTTGSMGELGQYCKENGCRGAYCCKLVSHMDPEITYLLLSF
jgi:hypothetical protein